MRTSSRAAEDGREQPGSGSLRTTRSLRRVARGSRLMMGQEWAASANELAVPVVAQVVAEQESGAHDAHLQSSGMRRPMAAGQRVAAEDAQSRRMARGIRG